MNETSYILAHKQMEMQVYVINIVDTDGLVLKNQTISNHHANGLVCNMYYIKTVSLTNITFMANMIRNYITLWRQWPRLFNG